jgi:carboxylesterase
LSTGFLLFLNLFFTTEVILSQIIPTAEPFFFAGKDANAKIGCLVTHGFTGAPKEVRWLGEYLNQQGYTVCGIRLNGHATKPADMVRSHWQDWLLSVEDGFNLLRSCTDQVFLLGLSMGGVLSLTAASNLPVQGVVAMSTPYQLPDSKLFPLTSPLSWFFPYMPKARGAPDAGWFDKAAFKQHVAYPKNPVRSAGELNKLLAEMRKALPLVKVPVLLIHSRNDNYVFRESMEKIHANLGSTDKQMMWVEGGGHVITEEPTHTVVFKAAADFINRVAMA